MPPWGVAFWTLIFEFQSPSPTRTDPAFRRCRRVRRVVAKNHKIQYFSLVDKQSTKSSGHRFRRFVAHGIFVVVRISNGVCGGGRNNNINVQDIGRSNINQSSCRRRGEGEKTLHITFQSRSVVRFYRSVICVIYKRPIVCARTVTRMIVTSVRCRSATGGVLDAWISQILMA